MRYKQHSFYNFRSETEEHAKKWKEKNTSGNMVHLQTSKHVLIRLRCKHVELSWWNEKTGEMSKNAPSGRWTRLYRYTPIGRLPSKERGIGWWYPWTETKVPRGGWSQARRKLGREVLAQDGSALVLARATDTPSSPAQQKGKGEGKKGARGWMETRGFSPHRPMQPTLSSVSFVR